MIFGIAEKFEHHHVFELGIKRQIIVGRPKAFLCKANRDDINLFVQADPESAADAPADSSAHIAELPERDRYRFIKLRGLDSPAGKPKRRQVHDHDALRTAVFGSHESDQEPFLSAIALAARNWPCLGLFAHVSTSASCAATSATHICGAHRKEKRPAGPKL